MMTVNVWQDDSGAIPPLDLLCELCATSPSRWCSKCDGSGMIITPTGQQIIDFLARHRSLK